MGLSLPKTCFTAAIATSTLLATSAQAAPAVFIPGINNATLSTATPGFQNTGVNVGVTYTVASGIATFRSLGFVDADGIPGLAGDHLVGIWNSSGQLVGKTVVRPTSTTILFPYLGFRYSPIYGPNDDPIYGTPITLTFDATAGPVSFTMGTVIPASVTDPYFVNTFNNNYFAGPIFSGPGFGREVPGTTLTYPGNGTSLGAASLAIVNASDQVVPQVPEPATLGVLAAGGAALLLRRRPRSTTSAS